jgi:hypothetical protein
MTAKEKAKSLFIIWENMSEGIPREILVNGKLVYDIGGNNEN